MSTYNPLSALSRKPGEWFLLFDEDDGIFYPAFWDSALDPEYPLHYIDDTGDLLTNPKTPKFQWVGLNGIASEEFARHYSWLPWPTPAAFPPSKPLDTPT